MHKEDFCTALILMAAGIIGAVAGGQYLLKPDRTGKRWVLVLIRIGVVISVLAVNLAVVGLRMVFWG